MKIHKIFLEQRLIPVRIKSRHHLRQLSCSPNPRKIISIVNHTDFLPNASIRITHLLPEQLHRTAVLPNCVQNTAYGCRLTRAVFPDEPKNRAVGQRERNLIQCKLRLRIRFRKIFKFQYIAHAISFPCEECPHFGSLTL